MGLVTEKSIPPVAGWEPKATLPGRKIGFLNSTETVAAAGMRPSRAATQRALVHIPCAICRGKPSAFAVSG